GPGNLVETSTPVSASFRSAQLPSKASPSPLRPPVSVPRFLLQSSTQLDQSRLLRSTHLLGAKLCCTATLPRRGVPSRSLCAPSWGCRRQASKTAPSRRSASSSWSLSHRSRSELRSLGRQGLAESSRLRLRS